VPRRRAPTTAMQLESIEKNLEKSKTDNQNLKNKIQKIFQISKNEYHNIEDFEITKNEILVNFNTLNMQMLEQDILTNFKDAKNTKVDNILQMVIKK
jgi:hypothetical protein